MTDEGAVSVSSGCGSLARIDTDTLDRSAVVSGPVATEVDGDLASGDRRRRRAERSSHSVTHTAERDV